MYSVTFVKAPWDPAQTLQESTGIQSPFQTYDPRRSVSAMDIGEIRLTLK